MGLNSANFVPKKGEDMYNVLQFKSGGKYYVSANKPGYLFWIHLNGGRSDTCCSDKCAYSAKLQHDTKPPFVGESCPGYSQSDTTFCGEVEFTDTGYIAWDREDGDTGGNDGWDCEEPGELLIFCPAEDSATEPGWIRDISNSNDDYNPLREWEENANVDWQTIVEEKFGLMH